jgi:hypothetical protein
MLHKKEFALSGDLVILLVATLPIVAEIHLAGD